MHYYNLFSITRKDSRKEETQPITDVQLLCTEETHIQH